MTCKKCDTEAVENAVLGKKFWYCRTCKEEVTANTPKPATVRAWDSYDEEALQLSWEKAMEEIKKPYTPWVVKSAVCLHPVSEICRPGCVVEFRKRPTVPDKLKEKFDIYYKQGRSK